MRQHEFRAMGCQMLAALDVETPAAAERLAEVPDWVAEWERRLSRFRDDSELAWLNRQAGGSVQVSDILWDVVKTALQAAQRSHGLVTPTLLAELELAGYDCSFDMLDAHMLAGSPSPATPSGDWNAVVLRLGSRSICLPPGVRLDLGGVAKGWAADRAAHQLAAHGPALIDAGGDISVSGPMADGSPWPIGVADPTEIDGQIELLLLASGGVATSGRDYRRWRQGGSWQHHIIDPRTGHPAVTDVLSATVVASSAREAEMAAKTVLILGSRAGLAWIEARPSLAALLVREDRRIVRSQRLEQFTWQACRRAR
ncbi:MAG: FAD:protein FMN transferase [Roseiflexaceae bacterium]